jgi:adenylyltransferase/sulfurtransferase
MKWISPEECKELVTARTVELIDVREPWEYEICNIGHVNIPMGTITTAGSKLDKTKSYLIVCKTGRRAEAVANLLERDFGFSNISVLDGGITAWYALTDPSFELY